MLELFCLTTYLLWLMDVFFNIQWVFLCAPLLANLFLYSYEAVFIRVQGLLKQI
jgi:hypothetical protein